MKLLSAAVLLLLCVGSAHGVGLNFVNRYMTFFRTDALFEDWEYSVPMAAMVVLGTAAAAQYGYLPVRTSQVARTLEQLSSRWRARSRQPYGYRHSRSVDQPSDDIDTLISTIQLLEEGFRRYNGVRSGPQP